MDGGHPEQKLSLGSKRCGFEIRTTKVFNSVDSLGLVQSNRVKI